MNADPNNCGDGPEAEPTSTATTVPMWLIGLMLVLLFLSAWVFELHGGWFEPKVYGPYVSIAQVEHFQPIIGDDWQRGKPLFEQTCALCHNSDGQGKPNQAPPLAGSEWVTAKGLNRLIRIPLLGLSNEPIEVGGKTYSFPAGMTGLGSLGDDQIAAVLTYIRHAWGNNAGPVTTEQVKTVRAKVGNRTQPTSPSELKNEPEE